MTIIWSDRATRDLDNIHAYIAAAAPLNPQRFTARLVEAAMKLGQQPNAGGLAETCENW